MRAELRSKSCSKAGGASHVRRGAHVGIESVLSRYLVGTRSGWCAGMVPHPVLDGQPDETGALSEVGVPGKQLQ